MHLTVLSIVLNVPSSICRDVILLDDERVPG
jgi:hypothetical protein